MKKLLLTLAISTIASSTFAAPPQKAIDNAARAGINLINTIISDAGKGNGNEVVVSSVSTINVPSSTVDVAVAVVSGESTTTQSTSSSSVSGDVTGWQTFSQGQSQVKKKFQDVTTTTTTTETTTTTQSEVTTTTTTNYETPVTTTTYAELDPGKSGGVNNSPEEDAPADLVETGETVQIGDPIVDVTSVELDPIVETEVLSSSTTTVTNTVAVCNPSSPNSCPI